MAAINIVQGEDRVLTFQIKEVDSNGSTVYMSLVGVTEIDLRVPSAAGSYISFLKSASEITIVDATLGTFSVSMTDTKTALLKVGSSQNAEAIIDVGAAPAGNRRIAQLLSVITVTAKLFP
jgi:hypothetical protein